MKSQMGRLVFAATAVTFFIASVGFAADRLGADRYTVVQATTVDPNSTNVDPHLRLNYVPDEIIVKFKGTVADTLAEQVRLKASVHELTLSQNLDELNARHRVKRIRPLFENFKAHRERLKALVKKDRALLTKKEKHILKRLARAPKGAKIPYLDRIYKIQVELEEGESLQEVVAAYNDDPDIEYAELNYIVSINLIPNDPEYSSQWALPKIDASEAWDIETGSSDIVVAVIDTGVDYNHSDLDDNMWTDENGYYGYDFINNDNDPMDDHGHGTHCSGTIAAEGDNGLNVTGVCWNGRIMGLKVLDSGGSGDGSDAVTAFYYAVDNGADVTSNSWGGGGYMQSMQDAIDYAYSQGVIMVAAAGNDNSTSPHYPAYCNHMIAVAATDSNDDKADFSNYGDWVDIAAPGVDILSLKLGGGTTEKSGTSMACPHIAGACALLLSLNPFLTCDEIYETLIDTADPIAPGICISDGRVNLFNAITAVHGLHLTRDYYSCSDEASIYLVDNSFAGQGSHSVLLGTSGGDSETVVLSEAPAGNGIFTGTIVTESGDPNMENGVLQVAHGEIITATYENGNDTAVVDCEIPAIFNVGIDVEGFELTVTFETDEPTTARVLAGPACGEDYIIEGSDPTLATSHTITVEATFETNCYFIIEATDAAGNETIDDNIGDCYTRGVGSVTLDSDYYSCSDVIEVELIDWDLVEQVDQAVTLATDGGDLETMLLIKEPAQPWIFRSTFLTSSDSIVPGDGILQVSHGEMITATYEDLDAGTGSPATVSDSAEADCMSSTIFNVQVNDITSSGVDVTFETDEATTARIRYGLTCNEPNIIIDDLTLAMVHSVYLGGLTPGTDYYFELTVWDIVDNETTDDNGGLCYQFTTTELLPGIHVPRDYATIQAAINAAVEGETVWVADGTYTGGGNRDIDFNGKAITVRSENGPENCIINCQGSSSSPHRGFRFHNGEGTDSIVSGFTIKNGFGPEEELPGAMGSIYLPAGGAIFCVSSSPTINNCIFSNNKVLNPGYYNFSRGGAIACKDGSPMISNSTFADNEAGWDGGAIYGYGGALTIVNCNFNSNTSHDGGAIECEGGRPRIENCIISNNRSYGYGGGVYCDDSDATIINCVVNNNIAYNPEMGGATGGGMQLECNSGQVIEVINCTIIGNWAENGGGGLRTTCCGNYEVVNSIIWNNFPDQIMTYGTDVTYSNIQGGYTGEGNINADPNFVSGGDYHLTDGSPCIDAGTNGVLSGFPPTDRDGRPRPLDGTGDGNDIADMGAFEFWSGLAAPFIALECTQFRFFALDESCQPEDQVLSIRNGWVGKLFWQVSEDCPWLEVTPTDGNSLGEINEVTISVDATGLSNGDHSCLVTISDPNAVNQSQSVLVQLRVGPRRVPTEYGTIQQAIDAVFAEGEIIIVANGTYTGGGNKNIDVKGKTITVMSENGPENCIIDCQNTGRGFYFHSGETQSSVIKGFTITNGSSSGIYCVSAAPTIINCIISGNSDSRGGGINCRSSSPEIINCLITGNYAVEYGGGIACKGDYNAPRIINCTISDNSAGRGGAIDLITTTATISNSILWNNSPTEIYKTGTGTALVTYSDVQGGWAGGGNINVEPLFAAPDDYHLVFGSPCVDDGTNNPPGGLPTTDLDGISRPYDGDFDGIAVADMGAYELHRDPNNPILAITPAKFEFHSDNPDAQTLAIWNATVGTLNWQITEDCDWLEVNPISGECSGEVDEASVSVNPNGLDFGKYNCVLTVSDPCDSNNVRVVSVAFLVNPEIYVPGDFQTIQSAIDAAFEGCEVIVADGIYVGNGNRNIDFKGKAITVRSENGPKNCIIDCQGTGSHRGFYFHSSENEDSILDGFTITNGYLFGGTLDEGAGIFCLYAGTDPTIQNCIITGNRAHNGGGISCYRGSPTIKNCLIINNDAYYAYGGGIYHWDDSYATITGCTISNNSANWGGGGVYSGYGSNPTITNCIIWDNSGGGISGSMTTSYCKVGVNPHFVDALADDYHLLPDSPCINAGDPAFVAQPNEKDIDGEPRVTGGRVDIGSDEVGPKQADFTRNGLINLEDFGVFSDSWNSSPGEADWYVLCDLVEDGQIDFADLGEFLGDWLWQAGWYNP